MEDKQNLTEDLEKVKKFSKAISDIKQEIRKDVVGQEEIVDSVITAIIAGGNVLLEGVPGVGKTRLVRSFSKALSLPFSRIQFTPDLMPSDVTGTNVIEKDAEGKMNTIFRRGPIFANLILADEINRATPKTQSAMLEVMQEHNVTVGDTTYKMQEPFFVLATENPIEQDGTYPLPEAQMDRFMFKLIMKFPSVEELADIVNMTQITMAENATAVVDGPTILEMRELAKHVPVIDEVLSYTMNLVANTHPEVESSPEAAKKLLSTATSAYWEQHFTFRRTSPKKEKRVGGNALNLMLINTVIPFLYAYGLHKADEVLCDRATRFLESLRAENNYITRMWEGAGLPVSTAADSQALIQLQKEYCDRKDCLRCRFGYEFLKGKKTARPSSDAIG